MNKKIKKKIKADDPIRIEEQDKRPNTDLLTV
jgi:hypothetical protein